MEILFEAGMASRYFLTESKTGAAELSDFHLILVSERLTNRVLSLAFEAAFNAKLKGVMGLLVRKAEAPQIEKTLDDLAQDKKPGAADFLPSFLVIAEGIDKNCLNALKCMKLRGYAAPAAINAASLNDRAALPQIRQAFRESVLVEQGTICVLKPVAKLRALLGLRGAVISTQRGYREIRQAYPILSADAAYAQKNRPQSVQEVFDEGSYD